MNTSPTTPTSSSSSLHETVLNKWSNTHTQFNLQKAQEWVHIPPKSQSPYDILQWAQEHPFLKVNQSEVPQGINISKGSILYDIGVKPPKRKKGPRIIDDDVYDAFPYIRSYVPRGLCILASQKEEEQEMTYHMAVYAMHKFTGGPGDDDDWSDESENTEDGVANKPRWEHYFLEPAINSVSIINTSKENGEASHLGQVRINNETYLAIGSKNVHILVQKESDIELYTDQRFRMAKLIAAAMMTTIQTLDKSAFASFMNYMYENNLTATFEFLQPENQHIELFDFEKPRFRFITFTSNRDLKSLAVNNLEEVTMLAKRAGFETTELEQHSYADQEQVFNNVRNGYGKEGSVLYYMNSDGKVIGLVKKKTIWYILVRAIREKIKPLALRLREKTENADAREAAQYNASRTKERIRTTMKQKQQWLNLSQQVVEAWTNLAVQFCDYLVQAKFEEPLILEQIDRLYPVVWKQFLTKNQLDDRIA